MEPSTPDGRTLRALVLGGVAWNEMVYLDALPDPVPQTTFARRSHRTVGSSGAGKALNLRRLGWDVTLWAAVGDDDDGDRIRARMAEEGIRFITAHDPAGTMHHVNLMDPAGERISIFANSGSPNLVVDHALIRPLLVGVDVVSVTIFDHCRGFLPILTGAGVRPWIDIHDYDGENPHHDDFIRAAGHLTMSSQAYPGWRRFAEARLEAGTRVVICTHGAGGASVLTGDGWIHVPAAHVKTMVDSNGAGDGFTAAFADSWLRGGSVEESTQRAAAWAARVVASPELAPDR
jgi:sugar/nucleoside kinase (ribokinase family)